MKITQQRLIILLSMCLAFASVGAARANLVINGDFEDNTSIGTAFNLTNPEFSAIVANATAFGTSMELDLVTGTDYGIAPQSGNWKVGLHQKWSDATNVDAFSLDLSTPVVSGNYYNLQFFASGLGSDPIGPVEIGLSNDAESFGTLIYSGTPLGSSLWTQFDHGFWTTFNAAFLTVRVAPQYDMYAFVDNISLIPEPSSIAMIVLVSGCGVVIRRRFAV